MLSFLFNRNKPSQSSPSLRQSELDSFDEQGQFELGGLGKVKKIGKSSSDLRGIVRRRPIDGNALQAVMPRLEKLKNLRNPGVLNLLDYSVSKNGALCGESFSLSEYYQLPSPPLKASDTSTLSETLKTAIGAAKGMGELGGLGGVDPTRVLVEPRGAVKMVVAVEGSDRAARAAKAGAAASAGRGVFAAPETMRGAAGWDPEKDDAFCLGLVLLDAGAPESPANAGGKGRGLTGLLDQKGAFQPGKLEVRLAAFEAAHREDQWLVNSVRRLLDPVAESRPSLSKLADQLNSTPLKNGGFPLESPRHSENERLEGEVGKALRGFLPENGHGPAGSQIHLANEAAFEFNRNHIPDPFDEPIGSSNLYPQTLSQRLSVRSSTPFFEGISYPPTHQPVNPSAPLIPYPSTAQHLNPSSPVNVQTSIGQLYAPKSTQNRISNPADFSYSQPLNPITPPAQLYASQYIEGPLPATTKLPSSQNIPLPYPSTPAPTYVPSSRPFTQPPLYPSYSEIPREIHLSHSTQPYPIYTQPLRSSITNLPTTQPLNPPTFRQSYTPSITNLPTTQPLNPPTFRQSFTPSVTNFPTTLPLNPPTFRQSFTPSVTNLPIFPQPLSSSITNLPIIQPVNPSALRQSVTPPSSEPTIFSPFGSPVSNKFANNLSSKYNNQIPVKSIPNFPPFLQTGTYVINSSEDLPLSQPIRIPSSQHINISNSKTLNSITPQPLNLSSSQHVISSTYQPLTTNAYEPLTTTTYQPLNSSTAQPLTTTYQPLNSSTAQHLTTTTYQPLSTTYQPLTTTTYQSHSIDSASNRIQPITTTYTNEYPTTRVLKPSNSSDYITHSSLSEYNRESILKPTYIESVVNKLFIVSIDEPKKPSMSHRVMRYSRDTGLKVVANV